MKHITVSVFLAAIMLVSLFAVVSSPTSVSGQSSGRTVAANLVGQTKTGTGPAATYGGSAGEPVLVAVDTSSHVWCNMSGRWSTIGGSATSSPAVTDPNHVNINPMLDVFVRGTDGAVWYRGYVGGAWSKWTSIGGQVAAGTGPAACAWGQGRLDVFVTGTDGMLYHKWSTNSGATWSGWQSLGGKLTSSPAASWPVTNQIGVFARGTDGACWYKEWTGTGWSSWKSLGGKLAPYTGPGVMGVVFNTGKGYVNGFEVFVQGTDHQLWWQDFGYPGSAWSQLPACPEVLSTSSPAVAFSHSGHTEVWVSTISGNLMYCFITGNWTPVSIWEWFSATSPP